MLSNNFNRSKKRFMMSRSLCCLLLVTISPLALSADAPNQINPESRIQKWRTFNINTVNNYIIAAYENLEKSAQSLNTSIEKLCLAPQHSNEMLNNSREAFHQTMDAWQYIQNIQFGPIQILMRSYSMQFWPDKKNHVSKHLEMLLQTNDPASLTGNEFHKASVSIKGLPAIERFLFEDDLTQQLWVNTFHCQVLTRISSYTANTSKALVAEWQEMKKKFSDISQSDAYFEDDIEASTTLLKTLVEPLEVIRDLKLLRPLGSEFGQQKVKRLESWRSQRSLRNIQMNIESLSRFYTGLRNIVGLRENALINEKFNQILLQISIMNKPIETSIETKAGYKEIKHLGDSLKTLHALLENAVTNQGIHLGFNSRDGD